MSLTLTPGALRALLLTLQGLDRPAERSATRDDVLAAIRQMKALQIDTIHVIARSPYLVLWSRIGAYDPRWLTDLLAERAIFEYWSHEACFLPIDDYPIYRSLMLAGRTRSNAYARKWLYEHQSIAAALINDIRNNGPVRSADFVRADDARGGWWNWKIEKMALEMLFIVGDLMIDRRENFQRVYNLRERVLPEWDDARIPDVETAQCTLILAAAQALGAAPARWLADYFRLNKAETARIAAALAANGALATARVEGWRDPIYIHPGNLPLAQAAADSAIESTATTLLSPFDPVVWDRRRALELFGFDYRIECYTPAPKRRYGYFTLPILHRGALIGRLDPKAHRKDGVFEVKALYIEPGVDPDEDLALALAAALRSCAAWHSTPEVVLRQCDPPAFGILLKRALS
ncbi:MAG: winged helix DNA-binding domain-containing protein [Roseiflexus sp.]|uniref:winged helix-turn-helix domain-containing protein n=1 Tax=Roseiflexus sp. TaxID=2562120 RepID=UPI0025E3AB03|nr:crosslink repair DNA glycosylase YcaQ family protein [Roseiflexus sp.]MCL6541375.1 winged helix DNA-binding domain-containing protein [Roseiflexus sp.]